MGASSGVRSPATPAPSGGGAVRRAPARAGGARDGGARDALDAALRTTQSLRAQLEDPSVTALAIASLALLTFALVRLTGGAPSAVMELGYAPIALAAYAYGWRGGLVAGLVLGGVLGPLPALLGFDRAEGPPAWLIRGAAFSGVGILIGRLLDRSASEAGRARARLAEVVRRERESLIALATAAESRDTDAREHLRRLELTSRRLAEAAGLEPRAAANVGWAAMLHDIGKLRVPDRVLLKPDPLSREEWAIVRLHPIWSEQALAGGEHLTLAREVARSHHENWDGSGYPDGLYGDRIPFAARVVRITDAFDAMTNDRPYQQPVSFEAALEELHSNAGRDFDPDLVTRFGELIRSDVELRGQLTTVRLGA